MKEVYITEENEHFILLNKLYKKLPCNEIEKILDCGTGKTSLSSLLDNFKKANIDAIVYYNDTRKIDSVNQNIKSNRIKLIEKDICKDNINKKYNLVLAHLLLGESITWGNTFENVLNKLINIDTDYLIIVDYKEDITIDYDYLNKNLNEHFEIIDVVEQLKEIPQKFTKFEGITYIGYLLKKYK